MKKKFINFSFLLLIAFSSFSHAATSTTDTSSSTSNDPYNSLDCSKSEVESYASKDNYKQPNGFAPMPSVSEYQPAEFNKELTEKGQDNMGCPTFTMNVDWSSIIQKYNALVQNLQDVVKQLSNLLSGNFNIDSVINKAIDQIRSQLNQGICQRMTAQFKNVMWDVIDKKYGVNQNDYSQGSNTFIHDIINQQNNQSNSDLSNLFDQMGAKKQGQTLMNFFSQAGVTNQGITSQLNNNINNSINNDVNNTSNSLFGNSNNNPFDQTGKQILNDANKSTQSGTNLN